VCFITEESPIEKLRPKPSVSTHHLAIQTLIDFRIVSPRTSENLIGCLKETQVVVNYNCVTRCRRGFQKGLKKEFKESRSENKSRSLFLSVSHQVFPPLLTSPVARHIRQGVSFWRPTWGPSIFAICETSVLRHLLFYQQLKIIFLSDCLLITLATKIPSIRYSLKQSILNFLPLNFLLSYLCLKVLLFQLCCKQE
jgi:hypothetical protein